MGHVGQAIEHVPVNVPVNSIRLEGTLSIPTAASGVVIFAHGSGSSRHSPRNRYVADILNEAGLATLLIDLLNADEQEVDLQTGQLRFDIAFLGESAGCYHAVAARPAAGGRAEDRVFRGEHGRGAALVAAAELPRADPGGGVARGPDRSGGAGSGAGKAPTLAIVGGNDPQVLELNRQALARMNA